MKFFCKILLLLFIGIDCHTDLFAQKPDLVSIAKNLYDQHRYAEAREIFQSAVDANKKDTNAWLGLGLTDLALRYDDAIKDFKKLIKLNPNSAEAYMYHGLANATTQSEYLGAIDDYNKAIKLQPSYAEAYYFRGNAKLTLE